MIIAVIDGMGGGIGSQVVSALRGGVAYLYGSICSRNKFNSH